MTLVEKAKDVRSKWHPGRPAEVSDEVIELSLAWARREVTTGQCTSALGVSTNATYGRIACSLRAALEQGRLVDSKTVRGWK